MLNSIKKLATLHLLLLVYSLSGIFSKLASKEIFLSTKFLLFYGVVLTLLFCYAIVWQQVIKRMSLTTAYANKAVLVIWGMVWGNLIFQEAISVQMILGAIIILVGVYLVVSENE